MIKMMVIAGTHNNIGKIYFSETEDKKEHSLFHLETARDIVTKFYISYLIETPLIEDIFANLGFFYSMVRKDYFEATKYHKKVFELNKILRKANPTSFSMVNSHYNLGVCYSEIGKVEEAIFCLESLAYIGLDIMERGGSDLFSMIYMQQEVYQRLGELCKTREPSKSKLYFEKYVDIGKVIASETEREWKYLKLGIRR